MKFRIKGSGKRQLNRVRFVTVPAEEHFRWINGQLFEDIGGPLMYQKTKSIHTSRSHWECWCWPARDVSGNSRNSIRCLSFQSRAEFDRIMVAWAKPRAPEWWIPRRDAIKDHPRICDRRSQLPAVLGHPPPFGSFISGRPELHLKSALPNIQSESSL